MRPEIVIDNRIADKNDVFRKLGFGVTMTCGAAELPDVIGLMSKIRCCVGNKTFDKEFLKIDSDFASYQKIGSGFGQSIAHVALMASKNEDEFLTRAVAYSEQEVEQTPIDGKPGIEYTFYEQKA